MKRNFLVIYCLMVLLLSSCFTHEVQPVNRSRIHVISLQENWTKLQTRAKEWNTDAYLISVELPIFVDSTNPMQYYAFAYFLSDSDLENMLEVVIDINGSLYSRVVAISPVKYAQPITISDWLIDSTGALDNLLTDDDALFLTQNLDKHCSGLSLVRQPQVSQDAVVWRISIYDCGLSGYERSAYMDALNGNIR